jgi:hypothetical protein
VLKNLFFRPIAALWATHHGDMVRKKYAQIQMCMNEDKDREIVEGERGGEKADQNLLF